MATKKQTSASGSKACVGKKSSKKQSDCGCNATNDCGCGATTSKNSGK